jgi:hypothetical protein
MGYALSLRVRLICVKECVARVGEEYLVKRIW